MVSNFEQHKDANKVTDWKVHVNSENNFPTAAGLASSAAGYACLVYALCQMYGVTGDISGLARQGSGSACRSVDGGFVRWRMGGIRIEYLLSVNWYLPNTSQDTLGY